MTGMPHRGLALAQVLSQLGPDLLSLRSPRPDAHHVWTWSPDVDVFERGDMLIVRIDLPGVSLSDVRVEIADDELTVCGERRSEGRQADDHWQNEERAYGRFFRRVPLPDGAWPTRATTMLANGVLEIAVPVVSWDS
jgi:HSP20 family molecular chaperone IbpA